MIGVDIVDVGRLGRALDRVPSLERRLFSGGELAEAELLPPRRRLEWLAGRFAAKEAIVKATGGDLFAGALGERFEIVAGASGVPCIRRPAGEAIPGLQVSITHDAGVAVAVVLDLSAVMSGH